MSDTAPSAASDDLFTDGSDSVGSVYRLKALDRDLLRALCSIETQQQTPGAISGVDIRTELHRQSGTEMTPSSVYSRLDTLANHGYIVKRDREPDNRSNAYELTTDGAQFLTEYRDAIVAQIDGVETLLEDEDGGGERTDGGAHE